MRFIVIPLGIFLILILSNLFAWVGFLWSYNVLTDEEPILTLVFEQAGEQQYITTIESPSNLEGKYIIQGDQWRIDTRFVKMKYWAHLLGVESRYAIDRLQGRYSKIEDENTKQSTAHQIQSEGITHFTLFGWNPFIDTDYGYPPLNQPIGFRFQIVNTGWLC